MHGGGGHVTAGGSICTALLTLGNSKENGWSPANSMESVLLQVKMDLSSTDPRPGRLAPNWNQPYSQEEAMHAYVRVARDHGWKVPDNLSKVFH